MSLTVVPLGVHVLDVLVSPVEAIPEGHGGQLVEQIRATAAGTAGGTALTLAKLGARTRSAGAMGRGLGRSPSDAAVLGCAAAALVAGGLGSDHGDFDLAAADAFAEATSVRRWS